MAGVAQPHIHLRFTWQAWHKLTSTVVLRGRRGTDGTGWRAWSGLGACDAAALCVAGVAQPHIHLRFTWQAWHNVTSTVVLRGRRGTDGTGWRAWSGLGACDAAALCVAGVAQPHINLRFTWQAWHNVTSTVVLRGRRGTDGWRAWSGLGACDAAALCVAGVAQPDIHLRFTWQAWHNVTSTVVLRGRRGTDGTGWRAWSGLGACDAAALCVAGVAQPDIHLCFTWQAWHKLTSTVVLRGRRGTHGTFTHHFVTHHLSHTTLSHTIFHTPSFTHHLCNTPSFTPNFVTHHLWHTIFDTPLCHTPLCHTPSFTTPSSTHHLSAHHFSHTTLTLSHTIFDTPSFTHHFVTHHFVTHHLSHTIFHTPSFSTPFFTHNFVTNHLWHTIFHTQLCHTHTHTIFHTPLCHTQFRLCHTPSLTHHLSHTTLSHTTLSHTIFHHTIFHTPSFSAPFFTHNFVTHHLLHTIFHTPLCHTASFATPLCRTPLCHAPSFTHNFVTHSLSHTTFTHTIFHTQLFHTRTHTHTHHLSSSHTIFHMPLCHTQLCFTSRSSTASFVFPSFPGPATTLCAHYWKKLSCGVIRSFNFWYLIFRHICTHLYTYLPTRYLKNCKSSISDFALHFVVNQRMRPRIQRWRWMKTQPCNRPYCCLRQTQPLAPKIPRPFCASLENISFRASFSILELQFGLPNWHESVYQADPIHYISQNRWFYTLIIKRPF